MHSIEVLAEMEPPVLNTRDPEGLSFEYRISSHRFSSRGVSLDVFEFHFTPELSSQGAATILFDLIKKYARRIPRKITINRQDITFDKAEIQQVIEKRITYKQVAWSLAAA